MSEQREEWMKKPEHERERHAIGLVVDGASGEKGKFERWLAKHDAEVARAAVIEYASGRDAREGQGA